MKKPETVRLGMVALVLGLAAILTGGCSDDDPVTPPEPRVLTVTAAVAPDTAGVDEPGTLRIHLADFPAGTAGLSLRIAHADSLVAIDGATALAVGDVFGGETVALCEVDGGTIHISVVATGDTGGAAGSGLACSVAFTTRRAGVCRFTIDPAHVRVIKGDGADAEVQAVDDLAAVVVIR